MRHWVLITTGRFEDDQAVHSSVLSAREAPSVDRREVSAVNLKRRYGAASTRNQCLVSLCDTSDLVIKPGAYHTEDRYEIQFD
jgi:hypothetical protein